jgi:hypothetical protein
MWPTSNDLLQAGSGSFAIGVLANIAEMIYARYKRYKAPADYSPPTQRLTTPKIVKYLKFINDF